MLGTAGQRGMNEPTYLGGFYAIGSHIEPSGDRFRQPKRWVTGGSVRLSKGSQAIIKYAGDTLVRVESVHAWGFALIEGIQLGMHWRWPPRLIEGPMPSLFVEPQMMLEPHVWMQVTLVMADLGAETLPRISDDEPVPLSFETHQETDDDGKVEPRRT